MWTKIVVALMLLFGLLAAVLDVFTGRTNIRNNPPKGFQKKQLGTSVNQKNQTSNKPVILKTDTSGNKKKRSNRTITYRTVTTGGAQKKQINKTSINKTDPRASKAQSSREFHVLYYSPRKEPLDVRTYVLGSPQTPKRYNSADGHTIQFHYYTKGITRPDRNWEDYDAIVFVFPPFLKKKGPLPAKRKGQLFVAWITENACLYPSLEEERVRALYPRIDYTISTSRKSSWWYSWTGALPLTGLPDAANVKVLQTKLSLPFTKKKPAVLAMYSNCGIVKTNRTAYLRQLSRNFTVESRGRCVVSVNNHQHYDSFSFANFSNTVVRKLDLSKHSMFTAAMENAVCPDYVSEKVFQALAVGSVPIYLGAPNAARDYLPSNSTIFASEYTADELAEYLDHLANNQEEYETYLAWKQKPIEPHVQKVWDHSIDHIVETLLSYLLEAS